LFWVSIQKIYWIILLFTRFLQKRLPKRTDKTFFIWIHCLFKVKYLLSGSRLIEVQSTRKARTLCCVSILLCLSTYSKDAFKSCIFSCLFSIKLDNKLIYWQIDNILLTLYIKAEIARWCFDINNESFGLKRSDNFLKWISSCWPQSLLW
jgi:hypothetical protein